MVVTAAILVAAASLSASVVPNCRGDDTIVISLEDSLIPAAPDKTAVAVGAGTIEHITTVAAAATAAAIAGDIHVAIIVAVLSFSLNILERLLGLVGLF